MATEDEGCKRHKNSKPKKTPQRGLGVAELERIITERQFKRDSPSRVSSSPSSSISANPNLPHIPSPICLPSSNLSQFQPNFLQSNIDHDLFKISLPISGNYELDLGENRRGEMRRTQLYQQPPMVNVNESAFPLELPSNQRYRGGYVWPDEPKVAGVKRPYPFALGSPPGVDFNYKLPPFLTDFKFEQSNFAREECSSSSIALCGEAVRKKGKEESCGVGGDFLTLHPAGECLGERLIYEFLPPSRSLSSRVVAGEEGCGSKVEDDDEVDLSLRL